MFLKLVYHGKIKKIRFEESYKQLENLHQIVKDIFKLEKFNLYFFDVEGDKIFIDDCHDLEYFID